MSRRLQPGEEFAGYRVERLIGQGGMSLVYLARDRHLGERRVALKIMNPGLGDDSRFRERFIRESTLAASIDHPNIIPIYKAAEAEGTLFIAMRYVEGTDLKRLLMEKGPLDAQRAVSVLEQIARALDAAHKEGLTHRDVKPANILIVPPSDPESPDHVYLSDFGLIKRLNSESGLTMTGQFVGTVDYMAPEQIQGKAVHQSIDIYALGCMLYECLTGIPPFEREDIIAVMHAHLTQPPPWVTDKRPDLPPTIDAVVARAMAKNPKDRYPTAMSVVNGATRALHAVGTIQQLTPSPVASLRVSPHSGSSPLTVIADASGSTAVDGSLIDYRFDFGDGDSVDGSSHGETVEHTFREPGTYEVRLEVTGQTGLSSSKSARIEVLAPVKTSVTTEPLSAPEAPQVTPHPPAAPPPGTPLSPGHSRDIPANKSDRSAPPSRRPGVAPRATFAVPLKVALAFIVAGLSAASIGLVFLETIPPAAALWGPTIGLAALTILQITRRKLRLSPIATSLTAGSVGLAWASAFLQLADHRYPALTCSALALALQLAACNGALAKDLNLPAALPLFGGTAAGASVVLAIVALIATFADANAASVATLLFVVLSLLSNATWSAWLGVTLSRSKS